MPHVGRWRGLLVCAAALLAGCARGPALPPWLVLRPGVQARLAASNTLEPERTIVYSSAAAAYAGSRGSAPRRAAAGSLVIVKQIDANAVAGKHAAAVADGRGLLGWVLADDVLRPVPPPGTPFVIAATAADGSEQDLFSEQDDDEGQPFVAASHVTYSGFTTDPGNPEYRVHVDDGVLAGYDGFVTESELQVPQTHAFRFVVPGG